MGQQKSEPSDGNPVRANPAMEQRPTVTTPSDEVARRSSWKRRRFLLSATSAFAIPSWATMVGSQPPETKDRDGLRNEMSLLGAYGSWASGLVSDPPELSFRRQGWNASNLDEWRKVARAKTKELIAPPADPGVPDARVTDEFRWDGLEILRLSWKLPYGNETRAVLLKPVGASRKLPAVLGLHDHGGNKYFGLRKITRTSAKQHPIIVDHQRQYYGGLAWANELAKRGYVVLVHDAFSFASRRVLLQDMSEIPWGQARTRELSDEDPENPENIRKYNAWAAGHEHVMAKSLFSAGTTWPGVFLTEDQAALSVLCARDEVDVDRVGCAGLSGGGLRTVYLGGLDARVKCAICVGFMSTWKDFLMNKSYTHTWMTYAPLLPKYLDFPEVLGLRVPLPTMVLSNNEDSLYTLDEMKRADRILRDVFHRAEAAERYQGNFYPGGHQFDPTMQRDAFGWFDRWLAS